MSKHKLIPIEPTKDMVIAGGKSLFERGLFPLPEDVIECCKAMLAAAPDFDRHVIAEVNEDDDGYWADILRGQSVHLGQPLYGVMQPAPEVAKLVEALERLVLAAQCRDNSTGDQIRLIETRAELSAAAKNAEEALALYRQQKGEA